MAKGKDAIRSDVGARSPYALAEAVKKRYIPWDKKSKKEARTLLKQTLGMPFDELFDPSLDSPLFRGLPGHTRSGAPESIRAEATPCSTAPTRWYLNANWRFSLAGVPAGTEYEDPIQGCSLDCHFLGALAAVRFSAPAKLALDGRPNNTYNISFYTAPGNSSAVSGANDLPLNVDSFVFARSRAAGEIWPAVFEKAYAKWLCTQYHLTHPKPPNCGMCPTDGNADHPTIAGYYGGSPYTALVNITGMYFANGGTSWPMTSLTADQIYTKIFNKCGSVAEGASQVPMVANTYLNPPGGVVYGDSTLVGNHTYSVLGVHTEAVGGVSTKFIVLRNPYGKLWGADPTYGGTLTLGTGAWLGKALTTEDGVFALKVDQFKQYFERFGWVQ
ncbi:MAG: C2 family cysteine protease [Methanoregulaceae archaeon]|nr:C2 family cysteine protease [Methanoregulaceae archaeon]